MTTQQTLTANIALRIPTWQTEMEGPTNAQARRMAARRNAMIEQSAAATAAGNDDLAFDFDCEAWDIERDLTTYGFSLTTGRPRR
jgi:hypothetical protein